MYIYCRWKNVVLMNNQRKGKQQILFSIDRNSLFASLRSPVEVFPGKGQASRWSNLNVGATIRSHITKEDRKCCKSFNLKSSYAACKEESVLSRSVHGSNNRALKSSAIYFCVPVSKKAYRRQTILYENLKSHKESTDRTAAYWMLCGNQE
jgi:hypothetical protein